MGRATPRAPREAGFTYVGLIVLVAIIGLVGAATLKVDALLRRAAAEEELLEIGAAFSAALKSYADATPRGQPTFPPTLQDLLKDPRFPGVRRHLRKIFVDPITGKASWGIVYAGNANGVLAVYSLSSARPLKVANFDTRFANLENREHLSEWKFAASGQGVGSVARPGQPGLPGQPVPPVGIPASLFPDKAAGLPAPAVLAVPVAAAPPADPVPTPTPTPTQVPPPDVPAAVPPPADASGSGEDKPQEDGKDEDNADSRSKRDRQAPPAASETQ